MHAQEHRGIELCDEALQRIANPMGLAARVHFDVVAGGGYAVDLAHRQEVRTVRGANEKFFLQPAPRELQIAPERAEGFGRQHRRQPPPRSWFSNLHIRVRGRHWEVLRTS